MIILGFAPRRRIARTRHTLIILRFRIALLRASVAELTEAVS